MTESLNLRDDFKPEFPSLRKKLEPLLFRHCLRVSDVGMTLVRESVVNLNDERVELHERKPFKQLLGERQLMAKRCNEVPTAQLQVGVVPNFNGWDEERRSWDGKF